MAVKQLIDASGVETGSSFNIDYQGNSTGVVQVDIGTTGSVKIQGRVSTSAAWRDIVTISTSGLTEVVLTRFMRADVTACDTTLKAWVQE